MSGANIIYLTQHHFGIPQLLHIFMIPSRQSQQCVKNDNMRTDAKMVLGVRASNLTMFDKNL